MEVKEGTVVSLAPNAVYYNGKEMPDWVRNDHWIVKSRNNDRVVLGKNVSETHTINSPVNIAFMTPVSADLRARCGTDCKIRGLSFGSI